MYALEITHIKKGYSSLSSPNRMYCALLLWMHAACQVSLNTSVLLFLPAVRHPVVVLIVFIEFHCVVSALSCPLY